MSYPIGAAASSARAAIEHDVQPHERMLSAYRHTSDESRTDLAQHRLQVAQANAELQARAAALRAQLQQAAPKSSSLSSEDVKLLSGMAWTFASAMLIGGGVLAIIQILLR